MNSRCSACSIPRPWSASATTVPTRASAWSCIDITDIVKDTGFKVFSSVAQSGGVVKAINAKGAGDWSRGDVEKLADIAAENGAKGMAWIAFTTDGKEKSPIIKFFSDEEFAALKEAMDVEPGDLLLFAADKPAVANAVLSALRLHMADALDVPREGHQLLWVVNFPMFKYDEDEKKYAAEHHPFTHVLDEDVDKIESDPLGLRQLQLRPGYGRLRSGRRHHPYPQRRRAAPRAARMRPHGR